MHSSSLLGENGAEPCNTALCSNCDAHHIYFYYHLLLTVEHYLTGEVISEEYSLEYGTDKMEMHVGAVKEGERAIVVDDLIATGGTLSAAIKLLGRAFF